MQTIYLMFGLIEGLLLIRFALHALAANADAGFARAVSAVTDVLVGPFIGLFADPQIATAGALELSTLVALIVYAAAGWLLARAAWLIFGESRSSECFSQFEHGALCLINSQLHLRECQKEGAHGRNTPQLVNAIQRAAVEPHRAISVW